MNLKTFFTLCGSLVSLFVSSAHGAELIKVAHKVSKLPEKRFHIEVTDSELRLEGVTISQEQLMQRLRDLVSVTFYCEVAKTATIPEGRIADWASLVVGSGGRFFYKKHRGSIDSFDHCFEYKETEQE